MTIKEEIEELKKEIITLKTAASIIFTVTGQGNRLREMGIERFVEKRVSKHG